MTHQPAGTCKAGLAASLIALCGCGASTLRVTAAPTLDTAGKVGFESMLSFGIGMPLDYHGRSQHYLQARVTGGGGLDGQSGKGLFFVGGETDYIYWAEPSFDVRFGLHGFYRKLPDTLQSVEGGAFGAHVALLPAVVQGLSTWIVPQFVLGPELRVDYVGMHGAPGRAQFSIPLVIEGNLLGAGD